MQSKQCYRDSRFVKTFIDTKTIWGLVGVLVDSTYEFLFVFSDVLCDVTRLRFDWPAPLNSITNKCQFITRLSDEKEPTFLVCHYFNFKE